MNHNNDKNHTNHENHSQNHEHTENVLEVKDLSVQFGNEEPVLKDISFSVRKGDVLAIIGPNGAGKTILFMALMRLISYDGDISWSKDIKLGYVPQKLPENIHLPLTVKEFFVLKSKKFLLKDNPLLQSVVHELKSVGLEEEILGRKLAHLSRGQFQRVLIAWAILGHPNVLLFDEPTAGIDIAGEDTVYNLLHKLQDERGLTILLISHDLHIVYRYANSVLCLNRQQLCFGEPRKTLTNEQIAKLYGESAFYHHGH